MSDDERIVEEYHGWTHGQRVRIEDPEHELEMISDGEEGTLHICEVGAAQYGNLKTAIYFIPDGAEEPLEKVGEEYLLAD